LFTNKRFIFIDDDVANDDELCTSADVQGDKYQSTANADLLMEKEGLPVNVDIYSPGRAVFGKGVYHRFDIHF